MITDAAKNNQIKQPPKRPPELPSFVPPPSSCQEDLDTFFQSVIAHAEETLAKTPEMLPVLKEAGVVDSGGQGLLEVYHGAYDGFLGKEIDYTQFDKAKGPAVTKIDAQTEADIKFGYCTEFIILLNQPMSEET